MTNANSKWRKQAEVYGTGDLVVGGVWIAFYAIALIAALVFNSDTAADVTRNLAALN